MIKTFDNIQLEKQAGQQYKFLELIYPFLNNDNYNEECCEIRPIIRDNFKYIKSLNLWRLDCKGKEEYLKFLNKINGKAVCLYYSAFTLIYDKEVLKDDGKPYEKGKINNKNSCYTQILACDFDNVSIMEHDECLKMFNSLGIETISIFTGHGFQDIILLDEKVYDKDILKKFTYLLLSRGFPVDEKIIDSARVLRMPYSFNCKEFDKKSNYYNDDPYAIPVKIIKETKKRYLLDFVFKQLEKLNIRNFEYDKLYIALKSNLKHIKEQKGSIPCVNNINANMTHNDDLIEIKSINEEYKSINFDILPEAIKNMLIETKQNYRNSVMLFLTSFFKNKIGLSIDKLINVMIVWGKRCNPPLQENFVKAEIKRMYSYNYTGTGAYTPELAKEFGYIDFQQYKKDNKIYISNDFIDNYDILSDGSVRIYLMMKLFEKIEEITEWDKNEICRVADISSKTFTRNIKDLVKLGYVDKIKGNRCIGESYKYHINKYYNVSKGFTKFETATLENMIYNKNRSLTNGEMKLYTFLCKIISSTEDCFAGQSYIGKKIGKRRNSVSEMTDSLTYKRYIKKDTYTDGCLKHCIYTLNY